ncbi:hypothetical protein [Gloeobacter kilaueensis]|uniref:ABC transporter substrate-binding protein n=1 Tax=Gloeobacter kilaueensis (strain ATCC BAA-2537 / CCAP 1431/1 / ULC 316 / JS1) TaxID=1183438 RepID=U5QQU3_GLOK1|nr:hypothetical protein [Gloeobacter kilaueensis]AGY60004.1 hypothetical protein GKIL_3758 [Gloeobacter kilaueensis JS1]
MKKLHLVALVAVLVTLSLSACAKQPSVDEAAKPGNGNTPLSAPAGTTESAPAGTTSTP